jgi:hypothetical protein
MNMPKFHVKYCYLATGMEGRADEEDFGIVDAETANSAIDRICQVKYPTDIMYGPNNSYSTREFFRHCLSATPMDQP